MCGLQVAPDDHPAAHNTAATTVWISTPKQVLLQPGCSCKQALQQLSAAGLQLPVLVKPLVSVSTDSVRPSAGSAAGSDTAAAAAQAAHAPAAGPTAAAAALSAGMQTPQGSAGSAVNDGHTLGVLFTEAALEAWLREQQGCSAQQQQDQHQEQQQDQHQEQHQEQQQEQRQASALPLPAVLQQYVPHTALYKVGASPADAAVCRFAICCGMTTVGDQSSAVWPTHPSARP
jgi:hypothetical protein